MTEIDLVPAIHGKGVVLAVDPSGVGVAVIAYSKASGFVGGVLETYFLAAGRSFRSSGSLACRSSQLMISRPAGMPAAKVAPVKLEAISGKAQVREERTEPVSVEEAMRSIKSVFIKAPTEVARAHAEQILRDGKGPAVVSTEAQSDVVILIASECGQKTLSFWSGMYSTTCEGSYTVLHKGNRLWSTTEGDKSDDAAGAIRKLIEKMSEKFLAVWNESKKLPDALKVEAN